MWDGITYPFPNFNCAAVDDREWICNFVHLLGIWLLVHGCIKVLLCVGNMVPWSWFSGHQLITMNSCFYCSCTRNNLTNLCVPFVIQSWIIFSISFVLIGWNLWNTQMIWGTSHELETMVVAMVAVCFYKMGQIKLCDFVMFCWYVLTLNLCLPLTWPLHCVFNTYFRIIPKSTAKEKDNNCGLTFDVSQIRQYKSMSIHIYE